MFEIFNLPNHSATQMRSFFDKCRSVIDKIAGDLPVPLKQAFEDTVLHPYDVVEECHHYRLKFTDDEDKEAAGAGDLRPRLYTKDMCIINVSHHAPVRNIATWAQSHFHNGADIQRMLIEIMRADIEPDCPGVIGSKSYAGPSPAMSAAYWFLHTTLQFVHHQDSPPYDAVEALTLLKPDMELVKYVLSDLVKGQPANKDLLNFIGSFDQERFDHWMSGVKNGGATPINVPLFALLLAVRAELRNKLMERFKPSPRISLDSIDAALQSIDSFAIRHRVTGLEKLGYTMHYPIPKTSKE